MNTSQLRKLCLGASVFPPEVIAWIEKRNLWNIWVPKSHGGLELSLIEGLKQLKELAQIDGSLGWTTTLCSGANYFVGNLQPEAAQEIFAEEPSHICFGGSGGIFGHAEKIGETYHINGTWRYATGAPYLSHFTLSAKVTENGKQMQNADGTDVIKSFVIPKESVHLIKDWSTMGMVATATHSFEVCDLEVDEKFSFVYDKFYVPQPIFKIPFSVFADFTLWVNYLGIFNHFCEEGHESLTKEQQKMLLEIESNTEYLLFKLASQVNYQIENSEPIKEKDKAEIHRLAAESVQKMTAAITSVYPYLGVKASRTDQQLNQIFRDYFTATQHHIFTKK